MLLMLYSARVCVCVCVCARTAEGRCSAHPVSLAQVSVCKCMEMSRWSLLSFLMCSSLTVMNSPSSSINYSLAEDTVGGITWKQDQVIQSYFLFSLSFLFSHVRCFSHSLSSFTKTTKGCFLCFEFICKSMLWSL